jgi:fermentation-respiration switch protein FrsA (DUF1100 family)
LNDTTSVGLARAFAVAGYTVLAFDMRANGESEGERFSLGEHERLDVAAAVDLLVARGIAQRRIALVGESMGAATVIQALLLRPDVGAVVADSAYASGAKIVDERFTQETGLPGLLTPGVVLTSRLFGLDLGQVEPAAIVRALPARAFFFVHCDRDELIPVHHSRDLRAASASPRTELWIASGCGHVGAYDLDPGTYVTRVLAFVEAGLR